jgi:hypothetical protein
MKTTPQSLATVLFTCLSLGTVGTTVGTNLTLSNNGTIQILSALMGTGKAISINASPSLNTGSYTFANNSADSTNALNFSGASLLTPPIPRRASTSN